MAKSDLLLGNNIPFVEAAHVDGKQRPTAILLRTSFTTGDKGAALGIAYAWHNPNNKIDSCHYVVDEGTIIRCVPDKVIAKPMGHIIYKSSISVNICYDPIEGPVFDVVDRTAGLVARLCLLYKINFKVLTISEENRWVKHRWRSRGGIILKTVGEFPTDDFFASIKHSIEAFDRR